MREGVGDTRRGGRDWEVESTTGAKERVSGKGMKTVRGKKTAEQRNDATGSQRSPSGSSVQVSGGVRLTYSPFGKYALRFLLQLHIPSFPPPGREKNSGSWWGDKSLRFIERVRLLKMLVVEEDNA